MTLLTPWTIAALLFALVPLAGFGFANDYIVRAVQKLPLSIRLTLPTVCVIPYLLIAGPLHILRTGWLLLYLLLPVGLTALLSLAAKLDPEQRGHWLDFLVLFTLGLAVDLRWFEPAWPHALVALNKLILLDSGLYGFHMIRQ